MISAERMWNNDIDGREIFEMIEVKKYVGYHTGNRIKVAVYLRTVLKQKIEEVFNDSKNTITMQNIDEFGEHVSRVTLYGILLPHME